MTKGTTSRGTRNDKTHILSRITGRRTYHIQKKKDSVRGRVCLIFYFIRVILFFSSSTGQPKPKDELLQVPDVPVISKMLTAVSTMALEKVNLLRRSKTKSCWFFCTVSVRSRLLIWWNLSKDKYLRMIIPIRCFTCGKVCGNKWEAYLSLLQVRF